MTPSHEATAGAVRSWWLGRRPLPGQKTIPQHPTAALLHWLADRLNRAVDEGNEEEQDKILRSAGRLRQRHTQLTPGFGFADEEEWWAAVEPDA